MVESDERDLDRFLRLHDAWKDARGTARAIDAYNRLSAFFVTVSEEELQLFAHVVASTQTEVNMRLQDFLVRRQDALRGQMLNQAV